MNPSLRRLWQKITALRVRHAPQGRASSRSRRSTARQPAVAYRFARELQQAIHNRLNAAQRAGTRKAGVGETSRLGRSEDEVAGDLLAQGLRQRRQAEHARLAWASLTGRERQVAELLRQDLTYRQVAARLGISPGTVRAYTRLILAKAGLRSRAELIQAMGEWKIENGE